ncbi:MAG: (4Fe-4S)-binding protein [Bacteroidota bacterium]
MAEEKSKEYSNGEITVVWKPEMCIHSKKCWKHLPEVFQPRNRPWVQIGGAASQKIMAQVSQCPSGALSIRNEETPSASTAILVEVMQGGPLIVQGSIRVKGSDGEEVLKEGKTALCRCGASSKKPFCDGSHRQIEFD